MQNNCSIIKLYYRVLIIYFAALDSFHAIAGFSTKPPEKRAKKF